MDWLEFGKVMKFTHVFLGLIITSSSCFAVNDFNWLRDDARKDERVLMKGIVIDPGGDEKQLAMLIKELGIEIVNLVLTHGHLDHVGGTEPLAAMLISGVLAFALAAVCVFLFADFFSTMAYIGWVMAICQRNSLSNRRDSHGQR